MTISQWFLSLLAVVMSFGLLIFIHELGHFLMAKRAGVRVFEFALGLCGPQLIMMKRDKDKKICIHFLPFLKKKMKAPLDAATAVEAYEGSGSEEPDETEYSIRLVPMGGFVDMREDDTSGNPNDNRHFQNKKTWDRIKIIACGPLMNYAMALLLFWLIGFVWGIGSFYLKPRVGEVIKGSPAERIGLERGDYICTIDGKEMKDASEMITTIKMTPDRELLLQIQRGTGPNSQVFQRTVKPMLVSEKNEKIRGIGIKIDQKALDIRFTPAPPETVLLDGLNQVKRFTVAPLYAFSLILKGKMKAKELAEGSAGPVGIGQMFFEAYNKGFKYLLYLFAIVNVLIGCFNLLPIPPLDGFRIALFGLEKIKGTPFERAQVERILIAGFVLLISIVALFTIMDILRIRNDGKFFN